MQATRDPAERQAPEVRAPATPPRSYSCTPTSPTRFLPRRAAARSPGRRRRPCMRRRAGPSAVPGAVPVDSGHSRSTGTPSTWRWTLAAAVVDDGTEDAIAHINRSRQRALRGDRHRRHQSSARAFQLGVDAACVYVNASTRFTDGAMSSGWVPRSGTRLKSSTPGVRSA